MVEKLSIELIFTFTLRELPSNPPPVSFSVWKSFIGSDTATEANIYTEKNLSASFEFRYTKFQLDFSDKFRFEVKFEGGSTAFVVISSRELERQPRMVLQLARDEASAGCLEVETSTGITSETVYLKFKGINLADLDTMSKSDPYFRVVPIPNSHSCLYQSEWIQDDLDPVWRGFFLPKDYLHRDRRDVNIRIEVFDDDGNSSDFIGACVTNLSQLLTPNTTLILHKSKDGAESGAITGQIKVEKAFVGPTKTLEDYKRTGVEFAMSVAIDFSSKNRAKSDPRSLHSLASDNSYLKALKCLSWFFRDFDSNGRYDIYGFGAKIDHSDFTNHFFSVASNVIGTEGVEQAYRDILGRLEFASPCYLHKVLQGLVDTRPGPLVYKILVILTQGDWDDLEAFKEQLALASNMPLSVVIVGVGNTAPHLTTADSDRRLMRTTSGNVVERDFVQQVVYTDFRNDDRGFVHEVFAAIPYHLREYMMANQLA